MEEVQGDRRARALVIQEVGDVKTDQRVAGKLGNDDILIVVEHRGIVTSARLAPGREARVETFGVRGVEELDQARQPTCTKFQCQRSAQRLIQIRLLTYAQGCAYGR